VVNLLPNIKSKPINIIRNRYTTGFRGMYQDITYGTYSVEISCACIEHLSRCRFNTTTRDTDTSYLASQHASSYQSDTGARRKHNNKRHHDHYYRRVDCTEDEAGSSCCCIFCVSRRLPLFSLCIFISGIFTTNYPINNNKSHSTCHLCAGQGKYYHGADAQVCYCDERVF
jgi:hypothetical protein